MRTIDWRRRVAALFCVWVLAGCGGPSSLPSGGPVPSAAPEGETEAQARYLQALVREEPRHWRARVRLANMETQAGRHKEAFQLLRSAASDAPRNLGLQVATAEAGESAGYLDWCLYGWQQVVRTAPRDPVGRLRLAQLYRRLGWNRDAAAQLAVAGSLEPNSLTVLRERATFHAVQGPLEEARRWARQLIEKHPGAPYGYSLLADLAASARRWREAVEYGQAAAQRAPGEPSFQVRQAQYLLTRTDTPDPEGALSLLERTAAAHPTDSGAQYWRGVALRRLGRNEEAARALEAAHSLDPAVGAVKLQLAELYRAAGQYTRADQLLKEFTRMQDEGRRQKEAATELAVAPLSAGAHLRMAKVYLEVGQTPEALVEYLTARRLAPNNQAAAAGVEQALKQQGRSRESLAPL